MGASRVSSASGVYFDACVPIGCACGATAALVVLEAALGWTLCVTGGGLLLAGSQYRAEGNHGRQHATAK